MFASSNLTKNQRRGVVLVLILGMLALLALIGVTFATFSNQAQTNARNFSQAQNFPDSAEMMDFALSQLIDDTGNPASVIRGHSLKRDMYGNDADTNGALLNGTPTGAVMVINNNVAMGTGIYANMLRLETNISATDPSFYGYNFQRWILRFTPFVRSLIANNQGGLAKNTYVLAESHEILADVLNDPSGQRVFYIAPVINPDVLSSIQGYLTPAGAVTQSVLPSSSWPTPPTVVPPIPPDSNAFPFGIPAGVAFSLDGRYLRAFNGPGISALGSDNNTNIGGLLSRPKTEAGNFRYNGNLLTSNSLVPAPGDPNLVGMDEDYDACDLENWFLSIQTADGQVVVPSFHRPGVISRTADYTSTVPDNDWNRVWNGSLSAANQLKALRAMSHILRPRAADGHSPVSFPDIVPDSNNKLTFDVDNDGDGHSDSVWLDLGYPAKRDNSGQLFKPMFAFMVVGLNGKLPLNTAGNLHDRDDHELPRFDHTEHLGYSPSEIDIRFALQNAYNGGQLATSAGLGTYTQGDNAGLSAAGDTAVPVALTQLRNMLSGTRLPDPTYNPNLPLGGANTPTANNDINWVFVNGLKVLLPNGVGDQADVSVANPNGATLPNVVYANTQPVAGRWAEEDYVPGSTYNPLVLVDPTLPFVAPHVGVDPYGYAYNNPIRAGMSVATSAFDARDDDYTTFDAYPFFNASATPPQYPEDADYYDAAGSISLPVERMRRFVTPMDISGDGLVSTYHPTASPFTVGRTRPVNRGGDKRGRVGYYHYFRPPGLPLSTFSITASTTAYNAPNVPAPLSLNLTFPANRPTWPATAGGIYDTRTNNIYHGYVGAMSPSPSGAAVFTNMLAWGGVPTDNPAYFAPGLTPVPPVSSIATSPVAVPTFGEILPATTYSNTNSNTAFISPGLNDANEMDLYGATRHDAPFGPNDLEWLYRAQDVDGSALQSRLKYLAPISFNNPLDGTRRRRLFALDSWEMTNFVFANDNPGNAFAYNSLFATGDNASLVRLSTKLGTNIPTPQLAQRDRRINLNFPLPVSNSPIEPLRQKWIRDTYTLLKNILPPHATDTPEELAQLSQYVVNIIDFRDPDATMTKFVNTDVGVVPPTATTSSHLVYAVNATNTPVLPTSLIPYDPLIIPSSIAGNNSSLVPGNPLGAHYLIQHGMEFQPVAINEIFAARFQTGRTITTSALPAQPTPTNTGALKTNYVTASYIELVNMLTKDALTVAPDSCDLDLAGWDFVIMPDDGTGRPDPVTGEIPNVTGSTIAAYPVSGGAAVTTLASPPTNSIGAVVTPPPGLATPIQAMNPNGTPKYYVIGGTSEASPTLATTFQGTVPIPDLATSELAKYLETLTEDKYYWLYLRRPPNPFDPGYDSTKPNDNRVVVDCFRFVYTTATGRVHTDNAGPTPTIVTDSNPNADQIFSLQRMQPYRGGHGVPPLSGVIASNQSHVVTAYGYSEQADNPRTPSTLRGNYNDPSTNNKNAPTTSAIYHTLGTEDVAGSDSAWHYLAFNDRDFMNVIELTMVPSCSPGLFTKQFTEQPPPIMGYIPVDATTTLLDPRNWFGPIVGTGLQKVWSSATWSPAKFTGNGEPHVYPYLNDEFFYTAANEDPTDKRKPLTTTDPNTHWWPEATAAVLPVVRPYRSVATVDPINNPPGNYVGGPGAAGWHRMLDFFEVPSPVFKSIGNVALGTNYDWARQDLRPGLLNLNLIVDEEVFLGLMGYSMYGVPLNPLTGVLNQQQVDGKNTPLVVTQVDDNGSTLVRDTSGNVIGNTSYHMPSVGVYDGYTDVTIGSATYNTSFWGNYMKACFSDFLKLRHGGSGYVFSGFGATGQSGLVVGGTTGTTTPIAGERPFRSLSFPDIDYTVMRPATLPPSAATTPITVDDSQTPSVPVNYPRFATGLFPAWPTGYNINPATNPLGSTPKDTVNTPVQWVYTQDPGVKNPYMYTRLDPIQPPPTPPRRLFQIPDYWGYGYPAPAPQYGPTVTLPGNGPLQGAPNAVTPPSNASSAYNASNNGAVPPLPWGTGDPAFSTQVLSPALSRDRVDLIGDSDYAVIPLVNHYLGGLSGPGGIDQRDEPYFRTEWLQKVTNLTTVRTHQYAVWITVGFFEVTRQGDPMLATVNPALAYDILGLELGALEGKSKRYRSFFLVDRTRATGFNPALPGDFRDCVVYRQLIEE